MTGFPRESIDDLSCPCCGARLSVALDLDGGDAIRHGTLRCECYEYPIVAGILVLRQLSPVSSAQNGAVDRLRDRDPGGALQWLLTYATASGVATSALAKPQVSGLRRLMEALGGSTRPTADPNEIGGAEFEEALHALRPTGYANYLYHRYANPSFLAAIPPLLVLGESCGTAARRRIIDVLCGVGHSSATLRALCPGVDVVMADADFVNLYIASRFIGDITAVCVDVDLPLPFADGSFDGAFCLDGLHYVRSKTAFVREMDRILGPDASWVFAHMHNASVANVNPGTPLTAQGYSRLFSFAPHRILPEASVLDQIRDQGFLDLSTERSQALESSGALTLFGCRDDALWRKHEAFASVVRRRPDLLAFNPLYRVVRTQTGASAIAEWVSQSLRSECTAEFQLFEDELRVAPEVIEMLERRETEPTQSRAEIDRLLRSFMVVSLPDWYPRGSGTTARGSRHREGTT
jgi:SAM-dependent methyltransferase